MNKSKLDHAGRTWTGVVGDDVYGQVWRCDDLPGCLIVEIGTQYGIPNVDEAIGTFYAIVRAHEFEELVNAHLTPLGCSHLAGRVAR